jgi:NAD(P)-dependent dehydrogenase (short-subunit alcohol dehydrogenase family)
LIIPSDASSVAAQKQVVEAVQQAFGGLDVLFVNAGIAELKPVEQWDEAAFDRSFAVNLKGPYFLIQALLPILANPTSIVLNTSVNAHIGMPNTSVYAATKAAMLSLVRTLSGELISRGTPSALVRSRRRSTANSAFQKTISHLSRLPSRARFPLAGLEHRSKSPTQSCFLPPMSRHLP